MGRVGGPGLLEGAAVVNAVALAISGDVEKRGKVDATPTARKLKIIHVAGSPVSQYYSMISVHYARQMLKSASDEETKKAFDFHFAIVLPGGDWCMTTALDEDTIAKADRLSHGQAISALCAENYDACVPHMFCWPGYTAYRSIMDLIGVPLVGQSADVMALITDKAKTKACASASGVPVPAGELLRSPDQKPSVPFPFVLKPCCEDNSMGISKVDNEEELPAAMAEAFKFDSMVVCERFIPLGREIRVAIIEDENGEPAVVLPTTEYLLTPDHPMRTSKDKITVTDEGLPDASKFFATNGAGAPEYRTSVTGGPVDSALLEKLGEAAKRGHKALGCRDFSIFDFRIDPDNNVFMLECQPVCSFARESAMIVMATKADKPELQHPKLFHTMLCRAAARKPKPYDPTQILGMKAK
jgi:D-alanine-D-alanine ligase